MAKEAEPPARFLGQLTVPIRRFVVSISLVDSSKLIKSLKTGFESSKMVLTNVMAFGMVVRATVMSV